MLVLGAYARGKGYVGLPKNAEGRSAMSENYPIPAWYTRLRGLRGLGFKV